MSNVLVDQREGIGRLDYLLDFGKVELELLSAQVSVLVYLTYLALDQSRMPARFLLTGSKP